jgi:hypothetical protein
MVDSLRIGMRMLD